MIVRDTEDALEREALEEITSKRLNSQKLELAHKKAIGNLKKRNKFFENEFSMFNS